MSDSIFTVVPMVSIRPNKIVFYNRFFRKTQEVISKPQIKAAQSPLHSQGILNLYQNVSQKPFDGPSKNITSNFTAVKKQVQPNKHNFEISVKAAANIKEKISWLYQLAKSKTRINKATGKQFSFKINFITLSLASQQRHTTAEITKNCLNQFLIECKKNYGLENYVWRLEFQKNGNVHYHIATDCYIDRNTMVNIWNRCQQKLGYVTAYQDKFIGLTFKAYCDMQNTAFPVSQKTLKKRFKKGKISNWLSPNSVDVRAVINHTSIAFYIAKYITKKSQNTLNPTVAARENTNTNLRLWYCSRSLSKLDKIALFIESTTQLVDDFYNSIQKSAIKIFDYCKVLYFTSAKESYLHRRTAWLLFNNYASSLGYVAA